MGKRTYRVNLGETGAWARRGFGIVWTLWFAAIIVVDAGVGSVLFLPLGLLMLPYLLLARQLQSDAAREKPWIRIAFGVTVGVMMCIIALLTTLTFGIGGPKR